MIELIVLKEDRQQLLVHIKPNIVTLMKDFNSYHIILKILTSFGSSSNTSSTNVNTLSKEDQEINIDFIYYIVNKYLIEIAISKNGCCSAQKIIEIAPLSIKNLLCSKIVKNSTYLINEVHGNYVLGYVISLKNMRTNKDIVKKLISINKTDTNSKILLDEEIIEKSEQVAASNVSFADICINKHSSNIIEKCFEYSNLDIRNILINYFINDVELIKKLSCDENGSSGRFYIIIY